jgi:signal transduction histidine kinase
MGGLGPEAPPAERTGVPGWLARHPVMADAALALAIAVIAALADTFGPGDRPASAPLWDLLLAAPLVLRRRRPAQAAGLIAAICLVQWLADIRAIGDLAFLVALYSLGAYERQRWILVGAVVVAEIGVVMAVTRWSPASDRLLPGLTATGTVTASWVSGIYVRMRRAYIASMVQRAQAAERDRDSRAQIAVAHERARMAREMHDVIAHSLSVMITLNDAAAAVEPSALARDTISQASEVGRQALDEMHRMLSVLRDGEPAELTPTPGADELASLVAVVRSAGLSVELAVTGDLATIPPTAQLALYRIVQESLTNVLKHARNVQQVTVRVSRQENCVDLCVDDDGISAPAQLDARPGHGVGGMAERAAVFGGHVDAGPRPGDGWRVTARLNLERTPAER